MDVALQRILAGRDGRSQMLTGLRGCGKTVLLNEYEQLAGGRGFFHQHLEATEGEDLTVQLAAGIRRVLLAMDARRRIGERIRVALGVLKAFSIRLPDGPELSIDVEPVHGPADSGDLATDLAGLFVELGDVARDHKTGVLLTVDELHFVSRHFLEALVMGLHRAAQLRLPITIASAGLPSLPALTGTAKTYAERMFLWPVIGSLTSEQAREALEVPAADEGVTFAEGALVRLIEITQGYPYFLQEFGAAAWDAAPGLERIELEDVEASIPLATAALDDGFFRVRVARTSDAERLYLRAMAELSPGAARSGEVAALLGKTMQAVAPTRDNLIKKTLCYSPRRGEIEFTVPMFDAFMRRWILELPGSRRRPRAARARRA